VQVGFATVDFFDVLGVQPFMGRDFEEADGTPFNFADPTALPPTGSLILSYGFWQRRFGGDPDVLGTTLQLAGAPAVVVGVLPADFELLLPPTSNVDTDVALWTSARVDFENAPRANVSLIPVGRLAAGVTREQAQGQVDVLATRLREEVPIYESTNFHTRVEPLHADLTAQVRPVVLALLGAVGFVLLIACVNVANLLLVRASARTREISVRAALGGSRGRLVQQMLSESVLLAALGGAVGLLVAQFGIRVLMALEPADLPRIETVSIDGPVLGFTLLASLFAAVLFGTFPALQATNPNLTDALKGRTDSSGGSVQRHSRNAMVVLEVALSLVLLIGAGLMVRSFIQLTRVEPGFNPDGVLTFQVPLPFTAYQTAEKRRAFQDELRLRLAGLPGVESVSGAFPLPLDGRAFGSRYGTEAAESDPTAFKQADYRPVLPGFFRTMQTRLLEGRVFTDAEHADSSSVVVIDEVLARLTWPDESAVGKRLLIRTVASTDPVYVEVIGVVEHQRHGDLTREGKETVYFTSTFQGSFGAVTYIARAGGDPLGLVGAVRAEVRAIDAEVPVARVRLMSDYVGEARAATRFSLVLIGIFGVAALLLASIGLYGVLSYSARQRTSEIGIRMAFGADENQIVRLIVGQGMVLALIGLGIGVVAAVGLTQVMETMLVEVAPTDPLTFAGISLLFAGVASIACYLPARRATRVDPMVTLRDQ
jgi:putative ABC transport system permease protein